MSTVGHIVPEMLLKNVRYHVIIPIETLLPCKGLNSVGTCLQEYMEAINQASVWEILKAVLFLWLTQKVGFCASFLLSQYSILCFPHNYFCPFRNNSNHLSYIFICQQNAFKLD